jgi:glyoxylase-like metal-dependent hydrolase (beta-lactamase superfamily II)
VEVVQVNGRGYDSNVYLVLCGTPLLIDTGTGARRYFDAMLAELKEHLAPKDLSLIVLTHAHYDHSGGAKKLQQLTGAKVFAHALDARLLARGDARFTGARAFGGSQERLAVAELGEQLALGRNIVFDVLHTPGHTPGSVSLYHRASKSLFCGDLIFANGGFGRCDLPGGDAKKLYESAKKVASIEVANLYPGHGVWVEGDGWVHVRWALEEMGKWL